uniref:Stk1 family PASTA domain-containing Ser/Thr kinase n=1 Tax=Eubacterium cellulosolvens TaxID=29322 RepID=UPI0006891A92|nr:Stk1 family PASTA domain-containing Ser/Thr kinase [[Eubacterium] cellulosolvens]
MKDNQKQCMGCMQFYDAEYDVCPHCGYSEDEGAQELLHLDPGTVLQDRYVVGKSIGYGGFGVTYIGWDRQLKRRLAIKEYLPSMFATRQIHHSDLMIVSKEKEMKQYQDGMKKFLKEGTKLAQLTDIDGIVHMYDCFEENKTAYIVMEYLEGMTLGAYLKEKGTLTQDETMALMIPILEALEKVHAKGLIHRDIAPDNIFLVKDEEGNLHPKLIDFGAAKFATSSHSKSLTVLIKPGYSPEEQYRSNGDQGTYTDVYALAACMYRMVTGIQPPDSFERRTQIEAKHKDLLANPLKYAPDLTDNFVIAILNALNVRIEDRTYDVQQFEDELLSFEPVKRRGTSIKKIDFLRWPLWAKISVPTGGAAAMMLLVFVALKVFSNPVAAFKLPEGMTRVPDFVTATEEEAQAWAKEQALLVQQSGAEYSPAMDVGLVLSQDKPVGSIVNVNTPVAVVISTAEEKYELPDVTGMSLEDARKALECMGLVVKEESGTCEGLQADCVIEQKTKPYTEVRTGDEITLIVSEGQSKGGKVPDFSSMTYEEALEAAGKAGVSVQIGEKAFSRTEEDTKVLEQDIEPGKELKAGEAVKLKTALKWHRFKMPNLFLKSEDTALQLLKNIGIKPEIAETYSEVYSQGLVSKQSVRNDNSVEPDSAVKITVSLGSKPFEMIDLSGMTEDEARKALEEKGLSVAVEYGFDEKVPEGQVISQDIAAGKDVTRGTEIRVVICSEKDIIKLEDYAGQDVESAKKSLTKLKMTVQVNEIYSDTAKKGEVIEQLPAAGSKQVPGSTVVLTISKGKDPEKEKREAEEKKSASKKVITEYRSRTRETTESANPSLGGWTLYNTTTSWTEYSGWSGWSESAQNQSEAVQVESKTQYQYRDKETTTASSPSLDGWTQTGVAGQHWGEWGAWSGWDHNPVGGSDSREVRTRTTYRYYCYICPRCGAHQPYYGSFPYSKCYTQFGGCGAYPIGNCEYWEKLTETPHSAAQSTGVYNKRAINEGGWWFAMTDRGPETGYSYRDRSLITDYNFERWGGWSGWQDGAVFSSGSRQVQTRTVYRSRTRTQVKTYMYERWGDWSAYTRTPIQQNENTEVQTRTVYE